MLLLDKFAVYLDGEYWRLLSVVLVHGSIIHLLFNMYALWIIGPIVEALYGPGRFLAIYLLCAAAGSAASYATSPNPAVGASGAVFGLFGALLVADRVHKPALTRNARNLTAQIGILIGINLVIGFTHQRHRQRRPHRRPAGGRLAGLRDGAARRDPGLLLVACRHVREPPRERGRPGRRRRGARPGATTARRGGRPRRRHPRRHGHRPYTWRPSDYLAGGRQPGVTAEAFGDAVGVSTLGSRAALGGSRLGSGGSFGGLRD